MGRAQYPPQLKKRTALLRKLKESFRRIQSEPAGRVVRLINPILRGWVNDFAVGHSSRCFSFLRDRVEKKMRRHQMRARQRRGFGWRRWSQRWRYEGLGLFHGDRIRRYEPLLKASPTGSVP
jgi:RNA-directed DNA polymerase